MTFDPNDLPEDKRQETLAQMQVTSVAWDFLRPSPTDVGAPGSKSP